MTIPNLSHRLLPLSGSAVLLGAALLLGSPAHGQTGAEETLIDWDAERVQMTRSGLENLLERLEEAANSSAYSSELRRQAESEAEIVRHRLEVGDFRAGDRIELYVRGEDELTETFPVFSGRTLDLPMIGEVPLEGVLRSELEEYLTEVIGEYIRDPVVRAESLLRISVTGSVGSPGFYVVYADDLIDDVLMQAGGPEQDANLEAMEITRGDRTVWADGAVEEAVIQGRTVDQLNLRAGDRIHVPHQRHRDRWELFRNVMTVVTGATSLIWAVHRFTR